MTIDAILFGARSQLLCAVVASAMMWPHDLTSLEPAEATLHKTDGRWPDAESSFVAAWSTERASVAVGADGGIITTTDGATWSRRGAPFTGRYRAVWGVGTLWFASGERGVILRSRDNGDSWERVHDEPEDQFAELWSIVGISANDIYTVGRTGVGRNSQALWLESHDGGTTWHKTLRGDVLLVDLVATSNGALLVNRDGELNRSIDGGATWTAIATPHKLHGGLWAGAGKLVIGGRGGTISTSADDGASWHTADCIGDEYRESLSSFAALGDTLLATGGRGLICASTDGGRSWAVEGQRSRQFATYAITTRASYAIVVGEDGYLLHRHRHGWEQVRGPDTTALRSVWGVTRRVMVAVGDHGTILRTIDGRTWHRVLSPIRADLHRIWGYRSNLYIVGDGGTLLRSDDGGATWEARAVGTSEPLIGVSGDNLTHRVYVASSRAIFRSDDQGETWERLATPDGRWYHDVFALGSAYAYASMGSSVVHTSDGGLTWETSETGIDSELVRLWGRYDRLYALGQGGEFVESRDGGRSWLPRFRSLSTLRDVWGYQGDVFIVGEHGTFAQVEKHGTRWRHSDTSRSLSGVWGADSDDLVTVGDGATILRSRDRGATWERQVLAR